MEGGKGEATPSGGEAGLGRLVEGRRWFAGKARRIAAASLFDELVADPGRGKGLGLVRVDYEEGASETYLVLLGRDGAGRVVSAEEGEAREVLAALLALWRDGAVARTRAGREVRFEGGLGAARAARIEPLGVEQTNTSYRVDGAHLLKLFRRIEPGENPEVEIGRFLLRCTSFRKVPLLEGAATYLAGDGTPTSLAVIQRWIDHRADGFRHLVDRLLRAGTGAEGAAAVERELGELGATTAELHRALATPVPDPAFRPEPVTAADAARWRQAVLDRAARLRAVLEGGALAAAAALPADWAGRVAAKVRAWAGAELDFEKIRVHGDYHLGQVLVTDGGFVVFDFEGEPARPLAERREKTAAAKDVAGLLRSIDYACAVAERQAGAALEPRIAARARRAYLEGYEAALAAHPPVRLFPARAQDRAAWLALFELDKVLYEIDYELGHRPDWAPIPIAGLVRLVGEDGPTGAETVGERT